MSPQFWYATPPLSLPSGLTFSFPLPTWHPSLPMRWSVDGRHPPLPASLPAWTRRLASPPEKPSSAASLPPPLGAFGPLLLGGGGIVYKSEETSPPLLVVMPLDGWQLVCSGLGSACSLPHQE